MSTQDMDTKHGTVSRARTRALAAVGLLLATIAACIIGYVFVTSMPILTGQSDRSDTNRLIKPDLYICSGRTEPPVEKLKRARRQAQAQRASVATLIKRVPRPLSLPPPAQNLNLNFTYNPPLYHDVGARCAWGHLSNRRVPHLEDVGIAYDFQQLEARSCNDPEECKTLCLRMHKNDDPYLCNYFTWHRQKKLALFYFLEPTIKWNLTEDNRVETYFWQCRETQCSWWWRPHRVWTHLSDSSASQLRKAQGLVAATQCVDFASCQFACETRPSYKELGLVPANGHPDDPSCSYIMMPSQGSQSRESFMFSMPQSELKNISYRGSSFYDSFELICDGPRTTQFPTFATTPAAVNVQQASAVPVAQPPPAPGASQSLPPPPPPGAGSQSALPPPPPPAAAPVQPDPAPLAAANSTGATQQETGNSTQKRQRREAVTVSEIAMSECGLNGESIDCDRLRLIDPNHPSECVQLNSESLSETPATITLESKHPVWLVMQHQASLDEFEQSIQLTPGLKHAVSVTPRRMDAALGNNRCGPPHLRHRRCTITCTDRMAIDSCGCTLTADIGSDSAALLNVPICDEQKVRECVHPRMEESSDNYFQCMKECKSECDIQKPFVINNQIAEPIANKDQIKMDLSFLNNIGSIDSHPIENHINQQFVYIWVPILILIILIIAFAFLNCVRRVI